MKEFTYKLFAAGLLLACLCLPGMAGAAARPLAPLPPAGVHPRIFFGPQEWPAFKRHLTEGEHAKVMEQITDQQFREHEAGLESFAALDLTSPDAATVAKYFRPDESRNILWGIVTLDAVARDDTARKALMARVITNYARIILASKRLGVAEWKGGTGTALGQTFNVWKNDQFDVSVSWAFGSSGFPLSYDLLYNDMTQEQRATVRRAIAAATQGRRPFGSGFPKGRAFSNWFGYDGDLAVMLASIEGEEGYDAATYARIAGVLQNYWDISFTPDGACHEDAYGPNLGLRAGSLGFLVLARHGHDIFSTPKYRNFVHWFAQELQPYPGGNMVGGASGNYLAYPTSAVVAKYVLPDDPVADYVYRYLMGDDYRHGLRQQIWLDFALFGSDWSGDAATPATLQNAGLPLTAFYPERGLLIARTDWSPDALALYFDARPDAFAIGHDTVERGNFSLFGLGRAWTSLPYFRITQSSTDFSLVHVDGKAEGWKAPSVKFLWHGASDAAAGGAADVSYAYDWQWTPPWPSKDEKFPPPWEPEMSDPRALGWPDNPAWLPHKLFGEEGIGFQGSYLWRRPYNPVRKAFRTALLARGPHPYALVVDDVRKDDAPHTYGWYMQLAPGLTLESSAGPDVVLMEPQGDRRLLVRVLQADGYQGAAQSTYVMGADALSKSDVMGNRLILSANAVEPKWKVMLFPFHAGQTLPTSTWNADRTRLTLKWDDQTDEVGFRADASGRTQAVLERGGETLLRTE